MKYTTKREAMITAIHQACSELALDASDIAEMCNAVGQKWQGEVVNEGVVLCQIDELRDHLLDTLLDDQLPNNLASAWTAGFHYSVSHGYDAEDGNSPWVRVNVGWGLQTTMDGISYHG